MWTLDSVIMMKQLMVVKNLSNTEFDIRLGLNDLKGKRSGLGGGMHTTKF